MLFQKGEVKKIQIDRHRLLVNLRIQGMKHLIKKIKERKGSLKYSFFLFSPMNRRRPSGKVSLCIFLARLRRASLALETALVLPVFFLGMVTMVSFMDIYKVQTEHLSSLCGKVKEAGMYAYSINGSGLDEITLPDVYTYQPVGGLVPLPGILMANGVKVHAWTGVEYGQFQDGETAEKMVYVTESGKVYHRSLGCSYLNLSVQQVSAAAAETMTNDYGEHYSACERCSGGQKPAGLVYITKKGNRYHNSEACSGLKRTVTMIKESQAAGKMSACSRCG